MTLFDRSSTYRIFKHYRSPLPEVTAQRVLDKYERMAGSRETGEAMFLFCYHHVKEQCARAAARLDTFVSLYGFTRNLSFASLILGLSFAVTGLRDAGPHAWPLAGLSLLAAITLFYRYLKFYRHFSVEVFSSFHTGVAEDEQQKQPTTPKGEG